MIHSTAIAKFFCCVIPWAPPDTACESSIRSVSAIASLAEADAGENRRHSTAAWQVSELVGDASIPVSSDDGEIIYDSLCITDDELYNNGCGATCGGESVFGSAYDLQAADDFELAAPRKLRSVTADYLTFMGACSPVVCVQFFESLECLAEQLPYWQTESTNFSCEYLPFWSELPGLRYRVILDDCLLPPGRWWVSVQPRTEDWGYWLIQSADEPCGGSVECDALIRDGGERNSCCDGDPGFGYFDWTPSAKLFGIRGTLAMQIQAATLEPGACCLPSGECAELRPNACAEQNGDWQEGRSCGEVECPQPSACCLPDGGCLVLRRGDCEERRGRWQEAAACDSLDCPKFGACCFDDGSCRDTNEDLCARLDGVWSHLASCAEADCPLVYGACCRESFMCHETTERRCAEAQGRYAGDGTACDESCRWCRAVRRFEAACNNGNRLRIVIRFRDGFEGQSCRVAIDGFEHEFQIEGNRVRRFYQVQEGRHSVALVRPDCGGADVECP